MTFYQCFFIMFLNKCIEETSIIYYVLPHSIFWRTHWGNLYHLLCAFSFYFSIFFENTHGLNPLLLGKPLPFTMCFLILFPDERTEETSIIYYVLPHSIPWRARFSLKTRLRAQLALTGETPIIYYVLPHRVPRRAHCHWGNLYYLLCASSSYSPADVLRTLLLFTMCFPILFPGGRLGDNPIIYYVLPHRVLRRAHCHWGNLYYLVSASPVIDVRGLAPTLIMVGAKPFLETLGKPLLFSGCFP